MAQEGKNKKHFFKEVRAELKKVIWPTPKQLVNGTIAVIVIVLITAAIVFVLDLCFDMINNYGINNLKQRIENSQNVVENTVNDENKDDSHDGHDHDGDIEENTDAE